MRDTSLASKPPPPPSFPPHFLNTHPPSPLLLASNPPLCLSTLLLLMDLMMTLTLEMCMIMGELVDLIPHILLAILLIPCLHLLPREPGQGTIQHGFHLSLLNLLPLLKSPLLHFLALLQGHLPLKSILQLLSLHFSRESSPEIHLLLTGRIIGTR